jgi:hypothetical protein
MKLQTELHSIQANRWPKTGRHILAQWDEKTVVVYQAYRPEIGEFAVKNGFFGGPHFLARMSWVKPNFLWMMYRCGWASKVNQEVVLAVRLHRWAFEEILANAVPSSFVPERYASHADWERDVAGSDVRLQWDPDHGPTGAKLERRAIQLGLRGPYLQKYMREWIVEIEDVSEFVREQRTHAQQPGAPKLVTPREEVYPVSKEIAQTLGM